MCPTYQFWWALRLRQSDGPGAGTAQVDGVRSLMRTTRGFLVFFQPCTSTLLPSFTQQHDDSSGAQSILVPPQGELPFDLSNR